MDRIVWLAKTKHHADWVINADADEFWFTPSGSLKSEMTDTGANVLACEMRSVYPEDDVPWTEWRRTVRYVENYEAYDLSLYSIFERQNKKVAHRADGYLQISMGNHKVTMLPQLSTDSGIRIYHYNIRGKQQFLEKMINGGRQLEQHKGRHGGRHWRYFYKLYKEGKLEAEYDRVIGKKNYDVLYNNGFIYKDTTIQNIYKQINKE